MLTSELKSDEKRGELALSLLGEDQEARDSILDILRSEESKTEDKLWFRETVRWPIIECLMSNNRTHEIKLSKGDSVLQRFKPIIMLEVHRDCVDWSDVPGKTPLISSLKDLGYHVYAIRDYHDSLSTRDLPVEIIPDNKVFLEGPNHGFNMLATTNPESLINEFDIRIVENLSPKLIVGRDSQLHQPLHN